MFYLKKLTAPFVLPPGIFIGVLLVVGFWRLYRRRWQSAAWALGLGIMMWSTAIVPVAHLLAHSLEKRYPVPEKVQGDVIILLGGGINDRVPDMTGVGTPSNGMLARIVTAVRLQKRLDLPVIISGGKVYESVSNMAPIVRRFLIDLGVDSRQIMIESRSRDTFENAGYTKAICRRQGFSKPILITSALHLSRAVMLFEHVGLKVIPFPAGFTTRTDPGYAWQDFRPSASSMVLLAGAIHEYLGIFYYKLVL